MSAERSSSVIFSLCESDMLRLAQRGIRPRRVICFAGRSVRNYKKRGFFIDGIIMQAVR